MRLSRYTISTVKETPSDAEIASHRLLLQAGFVRQLAAGLYNWMPIGLRVLHKISHIIREEMDRTGAQEVMMPVVQPAELWQESGRWQEYDEGQLLKFTDRHDRDFCFGPTHEEVITDLARSELKSHRQLPVNFYQIQTKFRDETRPRFGLMRAREFLMKDGYSFHLDQASLDATYRDMHDAYGRMLARMDIDFRPVLADSGSIGGSASMEFHALADAGEDVIAFSSESDYAANIEMAEALAPARDESPALAIDEVATPGLVTIDAVATALGVDPAASVKTLIVNGADGGLVALVLRGDHQLNTVKADKLDAVASPLTFAEEADIVAAVGARPGSIGPVAINMPVIVDRSAAALANFVCGANRDGFHLVNVNWERDATANVVADIRDVVVGDPSPDGRGVLQFKRGIEVGHIFQLGQKYSTPMNATVLNDEGESIVMTMGCYGMGVSRLVAAIVEQHHDDKGMIWPVAVAPFRIIIIPVNAHKSEAVAEAAEGLYAQLTSAGVEVLLDDRDNVRPGAKFADAELIGIPTRVVIGDRGLDRGVVEVTDRASLETVEIAPDAVLAHLQGQ